MKSTTSNTLFSLYLATCLLAGNAKGGDDHFANATQISGTRYTSNEVSLLIYTKQVGEPAATDPDNAGRTAWWKWTAPADGICTVNTHKLAALTPLHATALGVFTGSAVNAHEYLRLVQHSLHILAKQMHLLRRSHATTAAHAT